MKEFYVVLEGIDRFQKEEVQTFPYDQPPSSLTLRTYERIEYSMFSSIFPNLNPFESFPSKDRQFMLKSQFYALGKNIAYYRQVSKCE